MTVAEQSPLPTAAGAERPEAKKRRAPTKFGWMIRDVRAMASLIYFVLLVIAAIGAPWIAPHSPTELDLTALTAPPSAEHWLGTDDLGRDTLSRVIHGAGPSLYSSLLSVLVGLLFGVPFGLMAGFVGGWVEAAINRAVDALLSFPTIIFAVGIAGVLGASLTNGIVAIGIAFAPQFARLMRATTLKVKQELYIDAVRGAGAGPLRILARHVLPNAVQPVVVYAAMLLGTALLAEASLSFLGLGVQPPQASWGGMIARAHLYMERAPEQIYPAGIAIILTALTFNSLGETLRILLDPKGPKA